MLWWHLLLTCFKLYWSPDLVSKVKSSRTFVKFLSLFIAEISRLPLTWGVSCQCGNSVSILPVTYSWWSNHWSQTTIYLLVGSVWLYLSSTEWPAAYRWLPEGNQLFGGAWSPLLIPLEQTTQTLCIISFLQERYLVNQCRLQVTVFPFNFTNNSFFCCLGSLVRQIKLQCCQVCWWPTVMLAEHSVLL